MKANTGKAGWHRQAGGVKGKDRESSPPGGGKTNQGSSPDEKGKGKEETENVILWEGGRVVGKAKLLPVSSLRLQTEIRTPKSTHV